jgi:hypothetical protein
MSADNEKFYCKKMKGYCCGNVWTTVNDFNNGLLAFGLALQRHLKNGVVGV